jgi:outer membrane protein assembly factor BamD
MFLKSKLHLAIALIFGAFLFSSCSEYEKLLKGSDLYLKYDKAIYYYDKEDYSRAITLLEQVKPYFKGTQKGDTADYLYAKSYYLQGDHIMAAHYYKEFADLHPRSQFTEEADYMSAYCSYLISPRPSLDQTNTYDALMAFQIFMVKYPKSERLRDCEKLIAEMKDKLVNKSYLNAKLYYNLGYYKASIIALRNSLNEYPDTKYREELMFLILRSSYLLASNSVQDKQKERYQTAVDEYYSFIAEFPKSEFLKDAQDIYSNCSKVLNL